MPVTYHRPVHATLDLARRVERAEIDFCAVAGASGTRRMDALEAGGGVALFSSSGSPLNKVLGLGLAGPVSDADLDRIEAFYARPRSPAQIELCPLAYADVAPRLCARGFVVQGFESEMGRSLDPRADVRAGVSRPDIDVRLTTRDEDDLWLRITAEGFVAAEPHAGGAPPAEPLTTGQVMDMMSGFRHPGIRRYLAWIDGEPAGGGAAWVQDGILGIFGTATLPRFRRRGVQTALTVAPILDGRGDADLAIATTAPGSTSQRTFERLGFEVLYTRTIFVKA